MNFDKFFNSATGHGQPFDYQRRLAGGDEGCRCESKLINIPTGLGKTAGVVLAWLWNRPFPTLNPQPSTLCNGLAASFTACPCGGFPKPNHNQHEHYHTN